MPILYAGFDMLHARRWLHGSGWLLRSKPNSRLRTPPPTFRSRRPPAPLIKLSIDLEHPAWLYPKARAIKRDVHLHIGPTNSGKSYTALQSFKKAKSGVYAGPLRMLAREVNERMESENVKCSLVTGDEVVLKEGATLYSATVEMVNLNSDIDVAVIDEIQMIEDPDRGWAWTRAFLGVRARTVHLCGDPSSLKIIEAICKETGDTLHVHRYERLSPLTVSKETLRARTMQGPNFDYLEAGDCIVCFTKKGAQQIRDAIVRFHQERGCCAIIHGSLPPETRAEQARLFNDPSSPVKYLVATDAIGMGLNLAIKRIIFTDLFKFDGRSRRPLTTSEIKQIAGRAGRFKTNDGADGGSGSVWCYSTESVRKVESALSKPTPVILEAVFNPPVNQIRSALIDSRSGYFSSFLMSASRKSKYGKLYTAPRTHLSVGVAQLFDHIPNLTFEDRMILSFAPVPTNNREVALAFQTLCQAIAEGTSGNIAQLMPALMRQLSGTKFRSEELEIVHKVLSLFLWLSYRFPCNFLDKTGAQELKELCQEKFDSLLKAR